MRIGIIGAGHAGVEAARTVAASGHEAVLFCGEKHLPYYRPRIVAYAFGQSSFQDCLMHDEGWYALNGITLRQGSPVTSIDADSLSVFSSSGRESFDGLILATGAEPVLPDAFKGMERVMPLWDLDDADRIRSLVKQGGRLVIIGGGVIGIETALRASDTGADVTILEKMPKVMSRNLTENTSNALCRLLKDKNVHLSCGTSVASLSEQAGKVQLNTEAGVRLEADVVIVSIGASRDLSMFSKGGIDCDRGIVVDQYMMTSRRNTFACGDIVQSGNVLKCSARTAMAQAKSAAVNLIAGLTGAAGVPYVPAYEPLMMKYKDTELYAAGVLPENGYEEEVIPDAELVKGYAARISKQGVTAGIQIVGTGKGLMKYLKEVK